VAQECQNKIQINPKTEKQKQIFTGSSVPRFSILRMNVMFYKLRSQNKNYLLFLDGLNKK